MGTKVCANYHEVSKRSLLSSLESLAGGKFSTILDIMNAVEKVGVLANDIKDVKPELHEQLQGALSDIKESLNGLGNDIHKELIVPKRSLLGSLESLAGGKFHTALDIMNAVEKVGVLAKDIKDVNPELHEQLQGAPSDIKDSLHGLGNDIHKELIVPKRSLL